MPDKSYTDKTLIVITGPTASGKSALAIDIAKRLKTQIISADSRQIYRDIPIVTALPSEADLKRVKHHLINRLPLESYYSASSFEQDALNVAKRIWRYNDYVVVVGGSMMYVDALCNGIDELPTIEPNLRSSLELMHRKKGDKWLLEILRRLDESYYEIVDKNNIKRVFHAVEICLQSGKTYTELRTTQKRKRPFKIIKLFLDFNRPDLFERINKRVINMVESGLIEEARAVYHKRTLNSLNTVGLKELFAHFDGQMDLDTTIARIQKNTRVYAKKQITWFAKDSSIIHINMNQSDPSEVIMRLINNPH